MFTCMFFVLASFWHCTYILVTVRSISSGFFPSSFWYAIFFFVLFCTFSQFVPQFGLSVTVCIVSTSLCLNDYYYLLHFFFCRKNKNIVFARIYLLFCSNFQAISYFIFHYHCEKCHEHKHTFGKWNAAKCNSKRIFDFLTAEISAFVCRWEMELKHFKLINHLNSMHLIFSVVDSERFWLSQKVALVQLGSALICWIIREGKKNAQKTIKTFSFEYMSWQKSCM